MRDPLRGPLRGSHTIDQDRGRHGRRGDRPQEALRPGPGCTWRRVVAALHAEHLTREKVDELACGRSEADDGTPADLVGARVTERRDAPLTRGLPIDADHSVDRGATAVHGGGHDQVALSDELAHRLAREPRGRTDVAATRGDEPGHVVEADLVGTGLDLQPVQAPARTLQAVGGDDRRDGR